MGEILKFKARRASERHRGNTLCRNGHHLWKVEKEPVFDVKQGKLVSRYCCKRCGKTKVRAD